MINGIELIPMYHLNDLSGTCHPGGYRVGARGKECLLVAVFFSLSEMEHKGKCKRRGRRLKHDVNTIWA